MDTVLQTVTTTQLESTSTTAPSSSPITVVADEAEDQTLAAAAGTSNPELSGLTVAERLRHALALVWAELASRASEQAFLDLLAEVYGGTSSDPAAFSLAAGGLASRLAAGDTLGLRYEIETASELAGATAAYAALGDDGVATIYVNGEWLQSASDGQLRLVLLEEIGHALDHELNGDLDTAGDEGELFSYLVSGLEISKAQMEALKTQNDGSILELDGQSIPVELSTFTRTSPTSKGLLPSGVTEVGGIVLDLVGINGTRIVTQLSASSLYQGFFSSSIGTIGTQTGFTPQVLNSLGGALSEMAVRITLFDGDIGANEFDRNNVFLTLKQPRDWQSKQCSDPRNFLRRTNRNIHK